MPDLCLGLAVLGFVLLVVTLLGHGIWTLVAFLARGGRKAKRATVSCVYCGRLTPQGEDRCDWCGRNLGAPLAVELADVDAVARQLRRFKANGTLRPEVAENMLARLQRYRRGLLGMPLPSDVAPEPLLGEAAVAPPSAPPLTPSPKPAPTLEPAPIMAKIVEPARPEPPRAEPPKIARPSRPVELAVPPPRPAPRAVKPPAAAEIHVSPVAETPKPPLAEAPKPPAAKLPTPAPRPAPVIAPQPVVPRRSWGEVLAAFMEERNIRWGEIVGGLLIVGSSIALVLSLWDALKQVPYFPFLLFVTVTSAIFGVGLYAHHRWKLAATSRGLLIISALLTPLNFLAMAALSRENWDWITLLFEAAAIGVFAWLLGLAAQVLTPAARWWHVLGVLGNSAAAGIMVRVVGADDTAVRQVLAGSVPVALFAAAVAGHLWPLAGLRRLDLPRAASLLTLLGTCGFAMLVALGLLVAQSGDVRDVLHRLAPLVALAAAGPLAVGLTVVRGTRRDAELAAWHTAGTTIALLGVLQMAGAMGMAWPHPLGLIATSAVNAAFLLAAAFRWRMPALHAGAIAFITIAYLTTFHCLYSDVPWRLAGDDSPVQLLRSLLHSSSGTAMAGLFVLFGLASELLARSGRRRHGVWFLGGSGVVAALGLLLVTFHAVLRPGEVAGGDDVHWAALRAAILYAAYGGGSLALAARWRRNALVTLGLSLLTLAPLWALRAHPDTRPITPLWAAVLAGEGLTLAGLGTWLGRWAGRLPPRTSTRRMLASASAALAWRAERGGPLSAGLAALFRRPMLQIADLIAVATVLVGAITAWLQQAAIENSPWPLAAAVGFVATCLLLAGQYRSPERTWAATIVAAAGLIHTLAFNFVNPLAQPWSVALLGHATLALAAALAVEWFVRRTRGALQAASGAPASAAAATDNTAETDGTFQWRRVFAIPLADSALATSALAVVALPIEGWDAVSSLALGGFWLAAVWLALAWRKGDRAIFALHQVALTAAVALAATAWLQRRDWFANLSHGLWHPWCLQAYGAAIGLLSLAWIGVRIGYRRAAGRGSAQATERLGDWRPLLLPPLTVDWCVRHLLVVSHVFVIVGFLLPGIGEELSSAVGAAAALRALQAAAFGNGAWLVVVVLAAALCAALWERFGRAELAATLLLAATVPGLMAGQYLGDLAVASALRWALSIAFVLVVAAVWFREKLLPLGRGIGVRWNLGADAPALARSLAMAAFALPVVAVTIAAAMVQLGGGAFGGPAATTFFAQIGRVASYVLPLTLVVAGMVALALRERSAGYAFSAGLVVELAVVLGHALYVLQAGRYDIETVVAAVQLATIAAAVWALAWLFVRRWWAIWRETPADATAAQPQLPAAPLAARLLMNVQIAFGVLGNGLLIGLAVVWLFFLSQWWQDWPAAVGHPLGWAALLLAGAAAIYRQAQGGRRPKPNTVGLLGMTVLALLACAVEYFAAVWKVETHNWGYRTLMIGWASYALLVVCAAWWAATVRRVPGAAGPPQAILRAAAVWVRIAAILAVVFGLKAAFFHREFEELLWAAAAIGIASVAGATMALWRRQEAWAFSAALGVNVAASLVVWFVHRAEAGFGDWWLRLVQANVVASAVVALVWLAVQRRLYQLRELNLRNNPLLSVQIVLPALGNAVLLAAPVVSLLGRPAELAHNYALLADPPGWLGLLLTAAAAGWFVWQTGRSEMVHVVAALLAGVGVLATCRTAAFGGVGADGHWFAYHTLTTAWAAAAALVLALGWLAQRFNPTLALPRQADGNQAAIRLGDLFPARDIQHWVTVLGAATVALAAIYAHRNPLGVWWNVGAVAAMSAAAGLLAMWRRLPDHVFFSGILVVVAGVVGWLTWRHEAELGLPQVIVLCLAIGSIVWSLARFGHRQGVPHYEFDGRTLPFAALAAELAVATVGVLVALGVIRGISGIEQVTIGRLDWVMLAATTVASGLLLWDRSSRFALPGLYCLALSAVLVLLCARPADPHLFCWKASGMLSGYLILAAAVGWLLPRARPVWRALRLPDEQTHWSRQWFMVAQAGLGLAVAGLAGWVALDFRFDGVGEDIALSGLSGRIAGAFAALMLTGAAVLMAWHAEEPWRTPWQQVAILSGVLLTSTLGWARLGADPTGMAAAAPWLHRCVLLMISAAMMTLVAGVGLAKTLPQGSGWIAAGRRTMPALAGLALVALLLVLAQEALFFELPSDGVRGGAPEAGWAIAAVAAALLLLSAGAIVVAVLPEFDPLQLSDRGRTAYVYAAEVLLALVGLHIWLTMPYLFTRGLVRQFWMLIVMVVAYAGAGLGEFFRRRRVPVLAEPLSNTALLLPALPAIGFWLMPETAAKNFFLGNASPVVWLMIGGFYALLSAQRRSVGLAALALLTANTGLWVLWHQCGWEFVERPQLWLIPLALAALCAEHLDRQRLNEAQRTAIRYAALATIYISSTTEFWRELGEAGAAVPLALVTIALAVVGVLAGVVLRVRSFLYMGATFLAVTLGRMIVYAAFQKGHMWLFWTCCILLGAAIIALFAVFEKRRNDILAAMDRFKHWQR